jgi:hypothetical protein
MLHFLSEGLLMLRIVSRIIQTPAQSVGKKFSPQSGWSSKGWKKFRPIFQSLGNSGLSPAGGMGNMGLLSR